MARKPLMLRLAKWHIWLGWLIGVPLLMWTLTGLVMVSRPIDEVRGEHLRAEVVERALPQALALPIIPEGQPRPVEVKLLSADPGNEREEAHRDEGLAFARGDQRARQREYRDTDQIQPVEHRREDDDRFSYRHGASPFGGGTAARCPAPIPARRAARTGSGSGGWYPRASAGP